TLGRSTEGADTMSWEARPGGTYYYRSIRIGGRVKKRYYGRGALATQVEWLDAEARRRRSDERDALHTEQRRLGPLEKVMKDLEEACRWMLEASLLGAGYYQWNRTWRFRSARKNRSRK